MHCPTGRGRGCDGGALCGDGMLCVAGGIAEEMRVRGLSSEVVCSLRDSGHGVAVFGG